VSPYAREESNGVNVLSLLAGIIYGVFLSNAFFGGSWVSLLIGALLGFFILSQIFRKLTLRAAGTYLALTDNSRYWTPTLERRAQRIAKVFLTLLIIAAIFGLLFGPAG